MEQLLSKKRLPGFSGNRVSPSLQLAWVIALEGMQTTKTLVPGVDYSTTFHAVNEWFWGYAACREYIRRLR
jgi:hypothetical protein